MVGSGLLLLAGILIGGCGTASLPVPSGPAQRSPQPTQIGNSLPPCTSSTATGCDMSAIKGNGRGSSGCAGKGPGTLTASPIALSDIAFIQPMGLEAGGHVTPIDHGYIYTKGAVATPPQQTAVFAPLAGNISTVTRTVRLNGQNHAATYDDDAVTIEATCTFRVRFSNLLRFAGGLAGAIGEVPANETKNPNYAVKAGN